MVVDFSKVDLQERPVLILLNTADEPIGVLGKATNIAADIKYNETSVLSFDIAAEVDGEPTPYYEAVRGYRTVDLQGIGRFILMNPEEKDDGVKKMKSCQAYSLEYEFTLKKITLDKATYNFWNPVMPSETLLGIILDIMPSWKIGYVDTSLIGKYRTFDVADENVYNFIKGTIQKSYNCIFDFDTYNREINVVAVSADTSVNPVYLSNKNLIKEISIKENTENIVTRLDVNGADGVTIRDVNPSGTNSIINLDYFMTLDNFEKSVIDKYFLWKKTYQNYQLSYYNLSVEYALQVMRKTTEQAALVELQSERTILENELATVIQGIAMSLAGMNQAKLDDVNSRIATKEQEIKNKQFEIDSIVNQCNAIRTELTGINKTVRFESYFTEAELLLLDRYIRDDSVSESSFVVQEVASYSEPDNGNKITNTPIAIESQKVNHIKNTSNKDIYDITGGIWNGCGIQANIIHMVMEVASDLSFVLTGYLCEGTVDSKFFPNGCLSITGTVFGAPNLTLIGDSEYQFSSSINSGYMYFTRNTSEYERRAVAWDLYEYGSQILDKVSQPSYTFSVDSANFLCLEEFESFKNSLKHGEKIYVALDDNRVLTPIFIGASIEYGDACKLTLDFCDTYYEKDQQSTLEYIVEQSISMGKSTDLSKFTYSSFVDSGASTQVKNFMASSLDVAKNAIMSSQNQAVSWDDTGIRLRKWADKAKATYDPKQVWMNNNSILMTSNNWKTAELAIGNFHDKNLGDCWGIVAPNIVGTLLAGSNLVIESTKKDGSNAVFKVDADGCVLYNSTFEILSKNNSTQISLDPQFGIVIGKYPVFSVSRSSNKTVNTDNARFWVDTDGNLFFQGTLRAATGEFDGKVTAREGYIGDGSSGWTIGSSYIYNKKPSLTSTTSGIYIGVDGISLGDSSKYVKATKAGKLTANDVVISGEINAKTGKIGDLTIDSGAITNNGLTWWGSGSGIYLGPSGLQLGSNFRVDSSGNLYASSGTFSGNVYAKNISYGGNAGYMSGGAISDSSIGGGKISNSTITGGKIADYTIGGGNIAGSAVGTRILSSGVNSTLQNSDWAYGVCKGWNVAEFISCRGLKNSGYTYSPMTIFYMNWQGEKASARVFGY